MRVASKDDKAKPEDEIKDLKIDEMPFCGKVELLDGLRQMISLANAAERFARAIWVGSRLVAYSCIRQSGVTGAY